MRTTSRLRVATLATLASVAFFLTMAAAPPPTAAATPPPAAATTSTLADRIIADAMRHLDAPYVWGSSGPWTFDCAGLIYRVFTDNGLGALIDHAHSGYELYAIFRDRGLASRTGAEPGDLVVYGNGAHVGIYLGDDRVISALVQGVRITGVYALTTPFTAFLHTGLSGRGVTLATTRRAPSGPAVARPLTRYTRAAAFLRGSAGTNGTRLAILPPGTRVTVLRSTRDRLGRTWDDVRDGTARVGWVANWLLRA